MSEERTLRRLWRRAIAGKARLSGRAGALIAMALVALGAVESRADPQIVTPSGLPQQVVPTYPEPTLPAYTYPQSGLLIDTGAVSGAVDIPTDGTTPQSFTGNGSGVSGATVASGYDSMLGQSVGSGQCVALAQATSNVGLTSTWVPGTQVQGNTDIAAGTVIATFGSDGTYTNTVGQSHTAIYLGQNAQGIQVMDQWANAPARYRTINWTTSNSYESGSQFYVVSH
ncbi:hypothetical protein GGD83_004577 [Rhodoblastus sphagnicola]|nr:hypothetical protein [Rhodoblastus sphagnicola]